MKTTSIIRIISISGILFLLAFLTLKSNFSVSSASDEMPVLIGIGGEFTALDSHNNIITESDLKGSPTLLAFGYTNCADICPVTVGYMRNVYKQLSPQEQKKVRFIFVTVDPEYDTPEHLNAYLSHFSPDFIGITGTQQQTDKIVQNFKVEVDPKLRTGFLKSKELFSVL